MLQTKVGYSENPNAFESGVETAKMANVIKNPQVGLFFTGCVQDQKELMKGAKSVLGNVPIIGCTSSAAICTQDGYLDKNTGYSGMMLFGGDCEVVTAGSPKDANEAARDMGRRLAKEATKKLKSNEKPDYLFLCSSPANEEEYLKGIMDVVGNVPVFGGSAADNTVEGKWAVLNDGESFADGCVIALFYTKGEIKNLYTGAYHETKNVGIVTKVKNKRCLVEIDHVPALKKYAKWTGKPIESLMGMNLLSQSICAPLGVKDPIGSVTAVRHPMGGNEDFSINVGANLEENTAIIQLANTPEGILKANAETVKKLDQLFVTDPKSYFLVHCGGRRLGLAIAKIDHNIYPEIKKAIPSKEFLMVFTFGEYGQSDHSGNTVGGLSLSFTGFGE